MLLELREARFDDPAALFQLDLDGGLFQFRFHGLNGSVVRPYFYLPALGIAGALRPHRTVAMMAAKALHGLPTFGGLAFVIELPTLRTGDEVGQRMNTKVLCGVGIIFGGFTFWWRGQNFKSLVAGGLQIGTATIAGVGDGYGCCAERRAQVFFGLLNHGHELTVVVLLPGRLAGHNDLFLFVSNDLSVIGVTIGVAHFHAAGFRFDWMIMMAAIGLELGQPPLNLFAQRLTLRQAFGQPITRGGGRRILCHDFEFNVRQRGIQLGQEFLHVFLAPAIGAAAGGLDFGAIQSLQGKANGAGVEGQLHGLFKNGAQGFLVVAPETPEAVMVRRNEAAEPEQRQMVTAGGFEFAGGPDAMEIAVEPDLQEQAWMLGRTAFNGDGQSKTQRGQIELIYKFA